MPDGRFLLIKPYSYHLWPDMEHALGQLLLAELTGRIPVVYWPTYYLQNGAVQTNGFDIYFEPVSGRSLYDITAPGNSFYPPVWDSDNILIDDRSKLPTSSMTLGDFICSEANVVVCDKFFSIYEMIPFIGKGHYAYGMTSEQIYRYLFNKYIRVRPDIANEIRYFYRTRLRDAQPVLAVHVKKAGREDDIDKADLVNFIPWQANAEKARGSSGRKKKRSKRMKPPRGIVLKPNDSYHDEIRKFIDKYNIKKIFLITDCEETLREYREAYGSMLVFTECERIPAEGSVLDMESHLVKRRRGMDLIRDSYLAARCDFFIGSDMSILSRMITRMKDWPRSSVKLLNRLTGGKKYPINMEIRIRREFILIKRLAEIILKILGYVRKRLGLGGADNA
jgi:hypothetical protein